MHKRCLTIGGAVWLLGAVTACSLAPLTVPNLSAGLSSAAARAFSLSAEAVGPWEGFIVHAIAFVMAGIAAFALFARSKRPATRAATFMVALCLVIEMRQLLPPASHGPHVLDLLVNICSATAGVELARWLQRPFRRLLIAVNAHARCLRLSPLALTVVLCLVVLAFLPRWCVTLKEWNERYPLLVGNEKGGTRPWLGDVRYVAIYDRAMGSAEMEARNALTSIPSPSGNKPHIAPIVAYDFKDVEDNIIPASGAVDVPPLVIMDSDACQPSPDGAGVRFQRPTVIATREPPETLTRCLVAADAFSIEVWCRPANLNQTGPARIVSLSTSTHQRNFTLGQVGSGLEFRVRNQVAGPNGDRPALRISEAVLTPALHHVVATYRHGEMRLYVDGRRAGPDLVHRSGAEQFWLGQTWAGRLVAAMLCVWPLVVTSRYVFAGRPRWMTGLITANLVLGVLIVGTGLRLLVVGHPPAGQSVGWALAAALLSYLLAKKLERAGVPSERQESEAS